MLHTNRSLVDGGSGQINIDMALKNANAKLSQWTTKWEHEMRRGERQQFTAVICVDLSQQQMGNHFISHFSTFSACILASS